MTFKVERFFPIIIFPLLLGAGYIAQIYLPGVFKLGALWSDHPRWWQFFTNGFLSGNLIHLALNMAGIWIVCIRFASQIRFRFLLICFVIFSAASSFLYFHFFMPPHATLVGASGGVYALAGFSSWFQRRDRVCFLGIRKLAMPFLPAMLILLTTEFLAAMFWTPVLAWQVHLIAFSISVGTAMAVHAVYAAFHWLADQKHWVFSDGFEQGLLMLRKIKAIALHRTAKTEI
jgi:membrane associated rhomboid family serine protease